MFNIKNSVAKRLQKDGPDREYALKLFESFANIRNALGRENLDEDSELFIMLAIMNGFCLKYCTQDEKEIKRWWKNIVDQSPDSVSQFADLLRVLFKENKIEMIKGAPPVMSREEGNA